MITKKLNIDKLVSSIKKQRNKTVNKNREINTNYITLHFASGTSSETNKQASHGNTKIILDVQTIYNTE